MKITPVNNFAPTVTKFWVMWEGQALPHDTKFCNCRDQIVVSRAFLSWSLIHGSSWSGLIKLEPEHQQDWQMHWCRSNISWLSTTSFQCALNRKYLFNVHISYTRFLWKQDAIQCVCVWGGVVIKWYNITWYCIHHCSNWGRIWIKSLNP